VEWGCLLCIHDDVLRTIRCKVYEPLAELRHGAGPLVKVQELLLLAVHEAIRDVVSSKSFMKLSAQHLVAIRKGGGE
jgi:hypothetical protein